MFFIQSWIEWLWLPNQRMTGRNAISNGLDNFPFTEKVLPCCHFAGLIVNAQIIALVRDGLNVRNRNFPAPCMFQCMTPQLMLMDDRPPLK